MKFALAILLLAIGYSAALAATARVAWDASPAAAFYWVKWGTNAATASFTLNTGTNLTAALTNLSAGRWYVWATAVSAQGIESDPSNVLALDVPAAPVIRLQLQGAAELGGTWTNLAEISVPIPSAGIAFYRGRMEYVRE